MRAVAHIHSDWSDDGSWTLPDLAVAFRARDVEILLMSEHSRGFTDEMWRRYQLACADATTDELLVVPGIEYNDPDNVVHVLVWGDDLPFFGPTPDIGRLLDQVGEQGGVAVLAHPWRRGAHDQVTDAWLQRLTAVELWNRKYDGWAPNRKAADLAARADLPAFAGLDFHRSRQFFPIGLDLDVAPGGGGRAVHRALRERRFVARFRGREAEELCDGVLGHVASGAEQVRRTIARPLRSVRR